MTKHQSGQHRKRRSRWHALVPILSYSLVAAALYVGWKLSPYHLIDPSDGLGYYIGIIGGSMMLILLLYPLRKRFRSLSGIGGVRLWFQLHVILGTVGPLLVVYHSNFTLGATNSNVALFTMLIVAGSGVFGRYIYSRIHSGLSGHKNTLTELRKQLGQSREKTDEIMADFPEIEKKLIAFIDDTQRPEHRATVSAFRIFQVRYKSWVMRYRVQKRLDEALDRLAPEKGWAEKNKRAVRKKVLRQTKRLIRHALKASEFRFYERMFSLWHILHIPMFFVMLTAAIVHIFAVHLY